MFRILDLQIIHPLILPNIIFASPQFRKFTILSPLFIYFLGTFLAAFSAFFWAFPSASSASTPSASHFFWFFLSQWSGLVVGQCLVVGWVPVLVPLLPQALATATSPTKTAIRVKYFIWQRVTLGLEVHRAVVFIGRGFVCLGSVLIG